MKLSLRAALFSLSALATTTPSSAAHASGLRVQVHVLLQGAYNTSTQEHRTDLAAGILQAQFEAGGLDATTMSPGFGVPADAVDRVRVHLRTTETACNAHTENAWLMKDGTLRDFETGTDPYVTFQDPAAVPGDYYIVIEQRNHLALMSSAPVSLDTTTPAAPYDFSAAGHLYGGQYAAAEVASGVYAAHAGDARNTYLETNANDLYDVDHAVAQLGGAPGYHLTDVDLSGVVDATDAAITASANGNLWFSLVPNFTSTQSISGPRRVCLGATATFSVSANLTADLEFSSYAWSLSGQDATVAGDGTPTATLAFATHDPVVMVTETDAYGCTHAIEELPVTVEVPPGVSAGPDTTVYLGYSPLSCADLAASVLSSAGTSLSYLWSNGVTDPTQMVCPIQTTTYTVEVTGVPGCAGSDDITVNVEDVRCGIGRVLVCVGPPAIPKGAEPPGVAKAGMGVAATDGESAGHGKPEMLPGGPPVAPPGVAHEVCVKVSTATALLQMGASLGSCP